MVDRMLVRQGCVRAAAAMLLQPRAARLCVTETLSQLFKVIGCTNNAEHGDYWATMSMRAAADEVNRPQQYATNNILLDLKEQSVMCAMVKWDALVGAPNTTQHTSINLRMASTATQQ